MRLVTDKTAWLSAALDKPVAIFGRGVSGLAAKRLIERLHGRGVLFDEGKEGRDFDAEAALQSELVITSPGFSVDHPWVELAEANSCRLIGEADFASIFWDGPVVAITGTNGKTTLTEFLAHSFAHAGIEAHVGGNIGTPLSGLIAEGANTESIAVCEISSFQAETLQYMNPDYVLWTNFDEDHLDRHKTMAAYFEAKFRLLSRGSGTGVFYDESVLEWAKRLGYPLSESGLICGDDGLDAFDWSRTALSDGPGRRCIAMALALWKAWGLDVGLLIEASQDFRKSPHRMEFAGKVGEVSYWNDSKATNFHATLGGLAGFDEKVQWIGGGKSKGGDIPGFARKLLPRVKEAYLIGETKFELQSVFQEHGLVAPVYDRLEQAVIAASEGARAGDNVVFSPGFASFDMFDGYARRGDLFKKAVAELGILE